MSEKPSRIYREEKTVSAMIGIYCRENHGSADGLCAVCSELHSYAMLRLSKCPFQEGKTTCGKCPIHCYRADMRDKVREVMRYSGPRMMKKHPVLALWHVFDGFRKKPVRSAARIEQGKVKTGKS